MPDPETGTVSPDRPLYNRRNAFWQSHSIMEMIASLGGADRESFAARLDAINAFYNDASAIYQEGKGSKGIPLA